MLTLNDGRSELWQWDTGRTLAVDADCSQVHFSNKVFGRSIDVDVVDGIAIIPDILLQTDNDLNVWAFVGTTENGYTKISKTFKVNRRNKPADYVFTPTDQMTLQTIQSQIGDLDDLTTEAKENLVAAINDAARTGSGAGIMDLRVAEGYVQYSTDGGSTWKNLIAVAELKGAKGDKGEPGAPGKDGAGMDVTGATVGQIAKISAVDASGVPTAWSPADMPSGGSPDALLYTPQTLTDAQKKQARENIDAASIDFVINGTLNDDDALTLDKTYAQIQEAVQAGKRVTLKVNKYTIDISLPLIGENDTGYIFEASLTVFPTVSLLFFASVSASGNSWNTDQLIVTDSGGNLVQISMDRDPEQPMEIATKQYVDTHATGGTDMGITGAAVGQIAKITAVDTDGVPTAWAPVDMPEALPNPNALTFTGAVTGRYDGSAPLTVNIPEGGGGTGGGYSDYEVLIDETITTDEAGISTIRYTELVFSEYNDIVILFDRTINKANSGKDLKLTINMLGYTPIFNHSIANPVDSYRSSIFRVLNMGNGNVASFACTANNQSLNPAQLYCCGIFPLNSQYTASKDNGFTLGLNEAYIGTIKLKILAK